MSEKNSERRKAFNTRSNVRYKEWALTRMIIKIKLDRTTARRTSATVHYRT